ncbi:hypothetical protein AMATHDRAFT_8748 [Amanita thiersii Skay4041]|uniref:Heme haloperoxidase family profile domain-containing protein n=1 Tax=Amanita thiersii Skay4041 TaxID=703135 RepID=A0A2A9ND76_9AGAR|nr:hypothetical protein AMATHDRAFT_8748 [Amanita thiersii Skay4041]
MEPAHEYTQPTEQDSRSPCPALNSLANHGYVAHSGKHIPFWTLIHALQHVYHLSLPLALLISTVGYLTCGQLSLSFSQPPSTPSKNTDTNTSLLHPLRLLHSLFSTLSSLFHLPYITWTVDLGNLSYHGTHMIAHDASLVHPNYIPSHAPDPALSSEILAFASHSHSTDNGTISSLSTITTKNTKTPPLSEKQTTTTAAAKLGLTLIDFARIHTVRQAALTHALSKFHEQIALGEYGLAWAVMHDHVHTAKRPHTHTQNHTYPLYSPSSYPHIRPCTSSTSTSTSSTNFHLRHPNLKVQLPPPPPSTESDTGTFEIPSRNENHSPVVTLSPTTPVVTSPIDDNLAIPLQRIQDWICQERLPNDWWTTGRPRYKVGLFYARACAKEVEKFMVYEEDEIEE